MDSITELDEDNRNGLLDFTSSNLSFQNSQDGEEMGEISENHFSNDSFVSFKKYNDEKLCKDMKLLLASTYVGEATHGRNGYFIPEPKPLRMYYWYNHKGIRLGLFILILINLSLVFFEEPAVNGFKLPYWVTMSVELICIFVYCIRLAQSWKFMPIRRHWRDRKIIIVFVCIMFTLIDIGVSVILSQLKVIKYNIRWTRILRPAFMVNFSESRQVRRTVRNIRRTLPEIASVLILFLLVIALYALLGVKLFENRNITDHLTKKPYFTNFWDVYFDLYVLTTTANNPDIMIPAYNRSNWYSLFFIVFTVICMYIFVSIFLAVVYKNYRTHLKNEVKSVVYRKRRNMKSAFDQLKVKRGGKWVVTFQRWKQLIHYMKPKMNPIQAILFWRVLDDNEVGYIEFKDFVHLSDLMHVKMDTQNARGHLFERIIPTIYFSKASNFIKACVNHRFFVHFFDLVIIVNALCIAFNLEIVDMVFIVIFNIEIILKLYTHGPSKFASRFWNIFDTIVIEAATLVYILEAIFQVLRYSQFILDFLLILRVIRLFKIIGNIQRFRVIISTIMEIGPAILTYGGIMFVLYYVYAIIGMEIFHGRIQDYGSADLNNLTDMQRLCGNVKLNGSEFSRLFYCEKNFNNIVKSYTILFDLTVVNQWHVITDGFVRVTHKAARIYFFSFHMLCVIVVLNIFVAFILEAFMLQYSLSKGNYKAALDQKIQEKGRASSNLQTSQEPSTSGNTGSLQRLDLNFSINEYMTQSGVTFKLRKTRSKKAEMLLQQMFEDELDEKDLGPELHDDDEDLDDVMDNEEENTTTVPRKLTLNTVDLI